MVVVVDYGMGNLGSILNMIKKVGGQAQLAGNPDDIEKADKLILPGVGAFDRGMAHLRQRGYVEVLTRKVEAGMPLLGICLGMQLLSEFSEEGHAAGLGWIPARTIRFAFDQAHADLKIPHMRWNTIEVRRPSPLLPPGPQERRFYFVHSYHVVCRDEANVLATTRYGIEFTSAVIRGNIVGTQFHPEKSLAHGIDLMRRFVHEFDGRATSPAPPAAAEDRP